MTNWRDMDPYDDAKHPDVGEPGDAREYVDPWLPEFDPAEDARDYQGEWRQR